MGQSFRVVLEKLGQLEEADPDEEDFQALAIDSNGHDEEEDDDDEAYQKDDPAQEDSFEIQIGHKVEAAILSAYEKKFEPISLHRSPDTIISKEHPWLGVHLDAIGEFSYGQVNDEAKTVGWYRRKEWGDSIDEIPPRVMWQVQDQMLVTGIPITHIPVCFIDARSLKYLFLEKLPPITTYVIRADEVLQQHIIQKTKAVAEYIEQGVLPPPDTIQDLLYLYKKDNGQIVEANEEIAAACVQLALVKDQQSGLKTSRARLEFQIKQFMKEAAELYFNDTRLATWKKATDGEAFDKDRFAREHADLFKTYLVPTTGSRRFLLKTKKEKK